MRAVTLFLFLMLPAIALSQQAAQREFPAGAKKLVAEDVKQRVTNRMFTFKSADGGSGRLEFKGNEVYMTSGTVTSSGLWRIDGSSVCFLLDQSAERYCAELRAIGETTYFKRQTGEVVELHAK